MIFPQAISTNSTIGVTAPSDGNRKEMDFLRLEEGIRRLEKLGHSLLITPNVRTSERGKSSSKWERGNQWEELIQDKQVENIVLAKGGDFLVEILPLIDYKKIKENPKWIQGFSDSTGLLFTITTCCDVATMYSNHFNDFAMKPWHPSVENNWRLLNGQKVIQQSFDYYEDEFCEKASPTEGFYLTKPVKWKVAGNQTSASMSGRLLGGCLDVLLNLVGTRFDQVDEFIKKYKNDGILWYLESYSLDAESVTRGLWQLKEAGWFEQASGFIFGRPCFFESVIGYSYEEAVMAILDEYQVPVVLDADVGHKNPQFTMVNGAMATIEVKNGKGSLSMEYI